MERFSPIYSPKTALSGSRVLEWGKLDNTVGCLLNGRDRTDCRSHTTVTATVRVDCASSCACAAGKERKYGQLLKVSQIKILDIRYQTSN